LERGNFDALIAEDVETAKVLDLPPYGALATVTGEGANAFVTSLTSPSISVHAVGQGFILRAKDVDALTLALRGAHRPPGRLRVAVE
jgi:hypothetical protein